jgi:transcriptional regulator GlxA family with amidase domain
VRIEIVAFDGVDELDAIGPFEVLQNAAARGADFSTRLVSWTGAREVLGAHGLRMAVEPVDSDAERPDLVVVPGGGWIAHSGAGARGEVERGVIPRRLAELNGAGTPIASVCTGAMLVAAAGLLRERSAATHHGAIEDLSAAGANVVDVRVVDDGELLSCGGVTSGIDLALWLVERFAGAEIAAAVALEMEYERRGDVCRRPNAS